MSDPAGKFPRVPIGSLANLEPGSFKIGPFGSSLKKEELVPEGIPVVGIENVLPNHFISEYRRFVSVEKFAQLSQYQIRPGDVLVTTMGTIGRAAVVPDGIETAIIDSHLFRMRLDEFKAFPPYLSYAINGHEDLLRQLERMSSGAIMAGLNTKILKACTVPLPSLLEQKRIATILNDQMAAVDRARAAAEAQLEAAKALPAAYLRAVFSSIEAQQWPRKRLDDVCELLPSKSIATDGDAEVQAVTTACLSEGGFLAAGIKSARMWSKNVAECTLAYGEVLVARSNTPELVGRVAMFPGEPKGAVASDLTIRIWPTNDITAEFLTAYLSFLYQTGYWKERAGGASGSMKKITREQIQVQQIPVPDVDDQQRIASNLTAQMTSACRARKAIEGELDAINKLPATLLRRAFGGEL